MEADSTYYSGLPHEDETRDTRILVGLSGHEDVKSSPIHIVSDYLDRERRENAEYQEGEQPLAVVIGDVNPDDDRLGLRVYSAGERFEDPEMQMWRNRFHSERLHLLDYERSKAKKELDELEHETEKEIDEDYIPVRYRRVVKAVVKSK